MSVGDRAVEGFEVRVPQWLREEVGRMPPSLRGDSAVAEAIRLAARNVEEGTGGPFAALVLDAETGAIVSAGVNLVTSSGLSSMHAEVVALSLAQRAERSWDLGTGSAARRIVVNAQPCAMCTGAVVWSGVSEVEFALECAEVERITGFDEGPIAPDWREQLEARGIRVISGALRDDAIRGFREFRARVESGASVVYNARRES